MSHKDYLQRVQHFVTGYSSSSGHHSARALSRFGRHRGRYEHISQVGLHQPVSNKWVQSQKLATCFTCLWWFLLDPFCCRVKGCRYQLRSGDGIPIGRVKPRPTECFFNGGRGNLVNGVGEDYW